MVKPVIALVGRPNVGKSTLFNRLSIKKKAIVHDLPGVTRDRKYADARLGPIEFVVVDTPGLENAKEGQIEKGMTEQALVAVEAADLVLLVLDGSVGVTPMDQFFAKLLRKHNPNSILVINKCEKPTPADKAYYKLGFGEPLLISAEHGVGMADLCTAILEKLGDYDSEERDPFKVERMQIAVIGRPNAGKSTFINSLLEENRVLVGPEAGVTRDAIDIEWEYKGTPLMLVDTAGLRKRANVKQSLEKLSTSSSIVSLKFANIVVLMVDATCPLEKQDLTIASLVIEEGRGLVIAINKWDLVEDKQDFKEQFDYLLSIHLGQVTGLSTVYISALNSENILRVIDACLETYKIWNQRITTSKLNEWLGFVVEQHPLPLQKTGRRVRIKYATQIKTRPPAFKFFCNNPDKIPESYQRYLINELRAAFKMPGVPIRTSFIATDNPYASKK